MGSKNYTSMKFMDNARLVSYQGMLWNKWIYEYTSVFNGKTLVVSGEALSTYSIYI